MLALQLKSARRPSKIIGEHIDALVECRHSGRRLAAAGSPRAAASAVPLQSAVDAVGVTEDRIREANPATATAVAEGLIVNTPSAAEDSLVRNPVAQAKARSKSVKSVS